VVTGKIASSSMSPLISIVILNYNRENYLAKAIATVLAQTWQDIGFGNSWFDAIATNNYTALVGKPNGFTFTTNQPRAIINAGNLAVGMGQSLTLLGGKIFNTRLDPTDINIILCLD
jgi:hypothetical protein